MATLFSLAINPQLTNRTSFWGKYANLNNAVPPTPTAEAIHEYQLQKIQNAQETVLKTARANRSRFKEVEDLIYNKNDIGEYTAEEDREIQASIQRIYESIGEIRGTVKTKNSDGSFKDAYIKKQEIENLLISLSNQLTVLGTKFQTTGVYDRDLLEINNLIQSLSKYKTLGNKSFKNWFRRLNQIQGELLEQMGIAWGRKTIPQDIEILDTAKVYLSSKSQHSGQLISDLIYLDMNKVDIETIPITYHLNGEPHTVSLQEFIQIVNNQSGKSEQIVINDEGYEILQKAIILQIQAKSGKTQLPWNANASTQVSILEFQNENPPGGGLSVLETLQLLKSLDEEQPNDGWVLDDNMITYYQAMANYGLATCLAKVMHLNADRGNQYLLTPDGIITFSERVYQLFRNNPKLYIKFSGSIAKDGKIRSLTDKYNVFIPWQQLI